MNLSRLNRNQMLIVMNAPMVMLALMFVVIAMQSGSATRAGTNPPPGGSINPGDFVNKVDNEFFPLKPGTTFYYEGETDGVPASNVTYVTHETKEILGVDCTVVHDQGFENGVLAEDTFDWYAQDKQGNVWYFGEDTKELDKYGNVISTQGSWIAGENGAMPGFIMKAHPEVGDRYFQEVAPGVAEDQAKVLSLDESACILYGCFDELLLTREWTKLDPGIADYKYYAEDIGFILGFRVKGKGSESTELAFITHE